MAEHLLQDHEYLGPLRIEDLVAKVAKASLKDTIRVMIALQIVGREFDLTLNEMVPHTYDFGVGRAEPTQVAAVEQAYSVLEAAAEAVPDPSLHGMRQILRYK